MNIPLRYADDDSQEGRFGAQERRRPAQDYQEPLPRNQDYYQELQDRSSNDDEWQESTVNDHKRRFWSHADGMRKKKSAVGINKKINCTSINNAGILIQVIRKKNFNIQILTMSDFLKEPIIIQIEKLIIVILVTPMIFLRQFGIE